MTGRTIAVTGASRGVGAAVTSALRTDGHRVLALCRTPADAEEIALDTADAASCERAADAVARRVESIDVLVNNAGIKAAAGMPWEASAGPLAELDPEAVLSVLRTNVVGALLVTQAFLPLLRPGSVVVNVSSQLGSLAAGVDVDYAYNASKAALNMVTVTMQRDLAETGIAVVSLNPGWIRTAMGGDEAPLDLDDAAADIARFLGSVDDSFAGRFVDRLGEPMPW